MFTHKPPAPHVYLCGCKECWEKTIPTPTTASIPTSAPTTFPTITSAPTTSNSGSLPISQQENSLLLTEKVVQGLIEAIRDSLRNEGLEPTFTFANGKQSRFEFGIRKISLPQPGSVWTHKPSGRAYRCLYADEGSILWEGESGSRSIERAKGWRMNSHLWVESPSGASGPTEPLQELLEAWECTRTKLWRSSIRSSKLRGELIGADDH